MINLRMENVLENAWFIFKVCYVGHLIMSLMWEVNVVC